jgi:hypothetical protein
MGVHVEADGEVGLDVTSVVRTKRMPSIVVVPSTDPGEHGLLAAAVGARTTIEGSATPPIEHNTRQAADSLIAHNSRGGTRAAPSKRRRARLRGRRGHMDCFAGISPSTTYSPSFLGGVDEN